MALGVVPAAAQQAASKAASSTAPAASSSIPVDFKKPVVKVNGVAVTERDVFDHMQRLFPYYSLHGGQVPEQYQAEIRHKAIDQAVSEELVFQEAKRRGIAVPPATMQKVLREAKARFNSPQQYEDYGKQVYGSVAEFERRIRRATLIEEFQHQEIELKSKVPEDKLRAVYDDNKASFLRPESVSLQSITVQLPPDASEDQKKLAKRRMAEILPQARAAKNYNEFGLLAERASEDEYRVNMGDHKWVHFNGLPAEVAKAASGLQPGQISGVVNAPIGYIILRVNDRRPAHQMTYEDRRKRRG